MFLLPPPLQALNAYAQFICYDKNTKMPTCPTMGCNIDGQDPANWMDSTTAGQYESERLGVGFVFTENDPFFFLDIDKCLDNGQWSPLALELLQTFNGAGVEVSKSGRGLHIIGTGTCPEHGCKNVRLGIELYTEGRYCALTGLNALGDANTDHTGALHAAVARYFPKAEQVNGEGWTTEASPEWNGPSDDDDLIHRARNSGGARANFNETISFAQLWDADEEALARNYPDQGGRAYDASSADAALVQHLAFWTGNNCERIQRLMLKSGLVRDKWDRPDYLGRTISRAVGVQKNVYKSNRLEDQAPAPADVKAPTDPSEGANPDGAVGIIRAGVQFMAVTQQIEFFKGCVYITFLHRVFVPSGDILKPEQFKAKYGGYTFSLDATNEKTTRNAWEVFTESQAFHFPKVFKTCFRPALPSGAIVEEEGQKLVNVYTPFKVESVKGDASRFYVHLAKILPDMRDQVILLSYMAACVQYKGVKFQWCPLIQGVEGNGKTFFTNCVAKAVGKKYSHMPKASDIDNKFNSWIVNKIFIGVEDIYVPAGRQEVLEALKPMITGADQESQPKGVDQSMSEICANFIMNSNHKDALRKTANDRRFGPFYTAQQCKGDLTRDGLTPEYFTDLYNWAKNENGYAIITHELLNYEIPEEFNPATKCNRAPDTSSTAEAINLGAGTIEQEIMEAVAEGRTGFAGGWLSMTHLTTLLHELRIKISMYKKCEILGQLGYVEHPALPGGRAPEPIPIDAMKKSRLYISSGSILTQLDSAKKVVEDYTRAQSTNQNQEAAQAVFNTGVN